MKHKHSVTKTTSTLSVSVFLLIGMSLVPSRSVGQAIGNGGFEQQREGIKDVEITTDCTKKLDDFFANPTASGAVLPNPVALRLRYKRYLSGQMLAMARTLGIDAQASVLERSHGFAIEDSSANKRLAHDVRNGMILFSGHNKLPSDIPTKMFGTLEAQSNQIMRGLIGERAEEYVNINSGSIIAMDAPNQNPRTLGRTYHFARKICGRVIRGKEGSASITVGADGQPQNLFICDPDAEPIAPGQTLSRSQIEEKMRDFAKAHQDIEYKDKKLKIIGRIASDAFSTYCMEKRSTGDYLIPCVSIEIDNALEDGGSAQTILDISLDPDSKEGVIESRQF